MQTDITNVVKTFRFPDPATTSMGIEFSDSEGSDASDGEGEEESLDSKRNSADSAFDPFRGSIQRPTSGKHLDADDDDNDAFNPFRPNIPSGPGRKRSSAVKVSSKDLSNQIHQLEKMMNNVDVDNRLGRRRSSAQVVEEFMREHGHNEFVDDNQREQRESYRQSTQSLLQFLLDSRQAMNMASSSPLPANSQNNIFRGVDYVVKNSNRMSTIVSVQSNRRSLAGPVPGMAYGAMEDIESYISENEDEIGLVEKELLGELDSDNDSELEEEDEDTVSDALQLPLGARGNRNTAQSATIRLLMENEPTLRVLVDPISFDSAPSSSRPPRISTLKRPSIPDIPANLNSNTPISPTSMSPEAKRRRSIPTTPQGYVPRPHTERTTSTATPTTIAAPSVPSEPPQQQPTLLDLIVNLTRTHIIPAAANNPPIMTLLSRPPNSHPITTVTVAQDLAQAAQAWRAGGAASRTGSPNSADSATVTAAATYHRRASILKLHACAVLPWLRAVHDPLAQEPSNSAASSSSSGGGITRSSVHPCAVALYILAACLMEGVNGVLRRDPRLGVLVLEMAAGVAVDDKGRGEEAMRIARVEEERERERGAAGISQQTGGEVAARVATGGRGPPPARKASLGPQRASTGTRGERGESKGTTLLQQQHYHALADPAWSLIDSFGQLSGPGTVDSEAPPTPGGPAPGQRKRLSTLHTLTPFEFLRLPTLRLAESYELGRGVRKSPKKAAYYYQVWNALGGGLGGGVGENTSLPGSPLAGSPVSQPPPHRNSISSGTSSNVDSGTSTTSGSVNRVPDDKDVALKGLLQRGMKAGFLK